MRNFTDVVQDRLGNALAGASVTVKLAGTATLATIYPSDAGSAYLPVSGVSAIAGSVVTTDVNGRYTFYAADGRYDLVVSGSGIVTTTLSDIGDGNDEFSQKITSVGTGLQIPSTITVEQDAYSGGVNEYPTGPATKTQFQPIRFNLIGRTVGERKGIQGFVQSYGKGDNIGIMASTYDFGGYSTGGDEGSEGGRFMTTQGDGTSGGGVPVGTVFAVATNLVTGSWTSGTNASLGEQRPLINTSRAVYSTGTISSVASTSPCIVTGTATGWTALGAGAKTDLFLNITGNDNGAIKHVLPILSITDDTHLVVEYNQAEVGAGGFGPSLTASGTYHIYKGGMVASLGTAGADGNATSVNLASGGSNFQAGDSIQQPLGYNYHGRGVQISIQRSVGEPNGGGVYVYNTGTPPFGDAFRATGAFTNGLRFDKTPTTAGIQFSTGLGGPFISSSDTTSGVQSIAQVLNLSSSPRTFQYDRANDFWNIRQTYFSGSDSRVSTNSTPQTNVQFYLGYNNASFFGLVIAPVTAPSTNAIKPLDVRRASDGTTVFAVEKDRVVVNNGLDLKGFSDNETTNKWTILGASGNISTSGSVSVGASGTAITQVKVYSQTITPASVAAITAAEQTFTVTGLTTADKVVCNPIATGNSTLVGACRVSASDTVAIQFCNPTAGALTPASGTYNFIAFRS